MVSLYDIGPRVHYGEFVGATVALVQAVLERSGRKMQRVRVLAGAEGSSAAVSMTNSTHVDIFLPPISPDTVVTGDFARTLLGLVLHEIAHMVLTDLPLMQSHVKQRIAKSQQGAAAILQAVEDYHIENMAAGLDAIFPAQTAALFGKVNGELQANAPQDAARAAQVGDQLAQAYALILASLDRHGHQGGHMDTLTRDTRNAVHPDVDKLVSQALSQLDALRARALQSVNFAVANSQQTTQGRIKIANDLINALANMQPQQAQPPQQQPDQGKGDQGKGEQGKGDQGKGDQGKGDQGKGDQGKGDQGKGDQGKGEQGKGEQGKGEQGKGQSTNGQPQGKGGQGASLGRPGAIKPKDADARTGALLASKTPKQTEAQKAEGVAVLPYIRGDVLDVSKGDGAFPLDPDAGGNGAATRFAAKVADTRRFADAARRALRAEDTVTVSRRLQTGRMDRRAITRASLGAHDVMQRKRLDEGIRTAVIVLVDQSGSMVDPVDVGGVIMERSAAVSGAAAVIVPAIERAGAAVALAGFTTSFNGMVSVHKDWNDRMPDVEAMLRRVGFMDSIGGTPMIGPALWAEAKMRQIRATRRVVIWLCDGQPNYSEVPPLKAMFERRSDIEHVGIGLGCNLSAIFGKRSVEVQDMANLASAFEALLIPQPGRK